MGSGWPPPSQPGPWLPPQFLQFRKSVVLTSNFAKSVVNLADMVREGWLLGGFVPKGLVPGTWEGGCLWGVHSQDVSPRWACPWRWGMSPVPGGFVPDGFVSWRRFGPQDLVGLSLGRLSCGSFSPAAGGFVLVGFVPQWLMGSSLREVVPIAWWTCPAGRLSPSPGGFVPGGFVPKRFVPGTWWVCPLGDCPQHWWVWLQGVGPWWVCP